MLKRKLITNKWELIQADEVLHIPEYSENATWKDLYSWGKRHKGRIFVWSENANPVAVMFAHQYKQFLMIWNFQVSRNQKRKGFGTKAMKQIKRMYKNKNIILLVKKNSTASKFYQKFGFNQIKNSKIKKDKTCNLMCNNRNVSISALNNYFIKESKSWDKYYGL